MDNFKSQAIEEKKRELKRYKKNRALVARLENKLTMLEDRLTAVRASRISDMPKGGRAITIDDLIADKAELEDRIARLKTKGKGLKAELLAEIDTLEDVRYAEILESFFVDGNTLEDIADIKGYTVRHVYRLYTEGVTWLTFNSH